MAWKNQQSYVRVGHFLVSLYTVPEFGGSVIWVGGDSRPAVLSIAVFILAAVAVLILAAVAVLILAAVAVLVIAVANLILAVAAFILFAVVFATCKYENIALSAMLPQKT